MRKAPFRHVFLQRETTWKALSTTSPPLLQQWALRWPSTCLERTDFYRRAHACDGVVDQWICTERTVGLDSIRYRASYLPGKRGDVAQSKCCKGLAFPETHRVVTLTRVQVWFILVRHPTSVVSEAPAGLAKHLCSKVQGTLSGQI
ncbi:hypothetical protein HBI56_216280 [Parastagonospora nodorum]|uniref:Uncharacterized protein n=1 Tax=Phaeosphaeria nodorum (strain SN15 / ATCC MYA-4574 / FGSC 10173) TaxID=321614 RepID=A0A7U2HZK8_PHANO|nr:hypothetical protein HBH56_176180 [Parastagonospora nodorum]QRC96209.1 hypothetical protein JI435_300730 [Parastagonospora nodorum SN15]KAH3926438.1 hypothetical protein HBH54_166980 [Parastagonospora nodorum]KAH3939095.1 hypothetical protein HBH53_239940 [Parastagonospora nodorum]KAH3965583.1 hypothetical protein HBH52_203620 [Parastagonospora nodorum]